MTVRRVLPLMPCVVASGCAGIQTPLNPAGPPAASIAWLTWVFFAVCGVVYVATLIALAVALIRRRREDDDAPQMTRRLGVAVGIATALTIVTLVALTISSVVAGRGLTTPSGAGAVVIDAIGHQFWWEFNYQDVNFTSPPVCLSSSAPCRATSFTASGCPTSRASAT
jgi:cytochrome c oxidase subunit 2